PRERAVGSLFRSQETRRRPSPSCFASSTILASTLSTPVVWMIPGGIRPERQLTAAILMPRRSGAHWPRLTAAGSRNTAPNRRHVSGGRCNMKQNKDFTITLLVDSTPEQVFDAINNVQQWWSGENEGRTDRLGEFVHRHGDMHRCTVKVTELVPGKKVHWHVVDNEFNFVKDKSEWKDTDIVFEIAKRGGKTELRFT